MPQYIGIDLHKATAFITRMDQRGRILEQVQLRNGAPQFRSLYHRVAKTHGAKTGRVAVARAMLKTIYAMLRKGEAFRPMHKGLTGQRRGVMATA